MFAPLSLKSQIVLCERIYLWEFTNRDSESDQVAKMLTNEVEDVLSSIDLCTVLQRRKFGELWEQIQNEKGILRLEHVPSHYLDSFRIAKADIVLFGMVQLDHDFDLSVRLRFENLITSKIRTETVILKGKYATNHSARKDELRRRLLAILEITAPELFSFDIYKKPIEEKIRKALHENGQNRMGSKVFSAVVDEYKLENKLLKLSGRFDAKNFLLPYQGNFQCILDISRNLHINMLEFNNIIDQRWTPVMQQVIDQINNN